MVKYLIKHYYFCRSIPNKLLCYSRSSPLIHTSFQSDSPSFGSDTNILSPVIEQLIFSYSSSTQNRSLQNRLSVLKITAISTQSSIFRRLQSFVQSETHEVMLVVINMQYSTVNHLRIMIEETAVTEPLTNIDYPFLFRRSNSIKIVVVPSSKKQRRIAMIEEH